MSSARTLLALAACTLAAPVLGETMPTWTNGLVSPNGDAGMLYMGDKGGFARAFGLDLHTESLRGDPLLLKALVAGQIDSYIGGPASPLVAASKGADIKIVGCNWNKQSYVLWGNAAVKTIGDMRGKSIGISTPGSAPDIFIRAALTGAGISPTDVNFLAGGLPSDWLKSMAAGVIDSAATPDEYVIRGKSMGLHVITTSDEATPLSMQRCYFVNGNALRQHRDSVVRFLAGEMAAYAYSLKHRDETIRLTQAILAAPSDAPEATANYDSVVSRAFIDTTVEPPMAKLRWLRDVLADNKLLDKTWDPATMIDLGPLQDARKLYESGATKAAAGADAALAANGVKIGP